MCLIGKVGEHYIGGPWFREREGYTTENRTIEEVGDGSPEGICTSIETDPLTGELALWFKGTPVKAGTYTFEVKEEVTFKKKEDGSIKTKKLASYYTIKIEEADKKEEEKDDDDEEEESPSSGMSYEEEQREAAKNFAPDTSKMTSEQSAGWGLVSREAPSVSSSSGGVTAVSAYQGPVCRLAFQLAAPGYNLGHTYDMNFTSAGGNTSMKVPNDLVKSGRKYAISIVYGGGVYSATPAMTPDANGNITFNTDALGLGSCPNAAVAIMYMD